MGLFVWTKRVINREMKISFTGNKEAEKRLRKGERTFQSMIRLISITVIAVASNESHEQDMSLKGKTRNTFQS